MLNAASAARAQAIAWTRPHLVELSEVVRKALEAAAGEPDPDAPDLAQARESAARLTASLRTLGIEGAARLAETLDEALAAVDEPDAETATMLLEGVAVLPDYLERMETGAPDTPEVLVDLINRMRAAVGREPLTDHAAAFDPKLLDDQETDEEYESPDPSQLRRNYQRALRDWLKRPDDLDGLKRFARQLAGADQRPLRRLGRITEAVFLGLAGGQVKPSPELQAHLASLDQLLRQWQDSGRADGDAGEVDRVSADLLKDVAAAAPGCDEIDRIRARLAEHAGVDPEELARARSVLSGRNRELFTAIAEAARGELNQAKDAINEFLLGRDPAGPGIGAQAKLLRSVAESFSMLGLVRLRDRVQAQAERLGELTADPENPVLFDVARELLLVESELDEAVLYLGEAPESDLLEGDGQHLPKAEHRRVMRQLLHEALEDLGQAKHLLDQAHRGQAEEGSVDQSMRTLERVAGVLRMAALDEAAEMLEASVECIADEMTGERDEPDRERLAALAEALVVVEFYLDSLTRLDHRGLEYLQSARQRLTGLGYLQASPSMQPESAGEVESAEPEVVEPGEETAGVDGTAEPEEPAESGSDEDGRQAPAWDLQVGAGSAEVEGEAETEPESASATEAESESESETGTELEFESPDLDAGAEQTVDTDERVPGEERVEADTDGQPVEPAADSALAGDDFDLTEIFLEEFDEEFGALETRYPRWRENPDDTELLTAIRRSFHTLKGSGRMAGAERIGEFAWQVEQMLNQTLDGQFEPAEVIDITGEAIRVLPSFRAELVGEPPEHSAEEIAAVVERIAGVEEKVSLPELEGLDPTLIQLMIKEIGDHLQTIDRWIEASRRQGWAANVDRDLIRSVHTIKGTLRLAPIGDEAETVQLIEEYLQELLDTDSEPAEPAVDLLEDMRAMLGKRLERLNGNAVSTRHFETGEMAAAARSMIASLHRETEPDRAESEAGEGQPGSADLEADTEIDEREPDVFDAGEVDAATEALSEAGDEVDRGETELLEGDADTGFASESDDSVQLEETAEAGEPEAGEPEAEQPEAGEPEAGEPEAGEPEAGEFEAGEFEAEEPEAEEPEAEEPEAEEPEAEEPAAEQPEAEQPEAEQPEAEQPEAEQPEAEQPEAEEPEVEEPEVEEPEAEEREQAPGVAEEPGAAESVELGTKPPVESETEDREEELEPVAERRETAGGLVEIDYDALDAELLELFSEEAHELLEHSDELLQQWRESPEDPQLVTALQRDIHTVKGSARMAGLNAVGEVAHVLEDLLESIAAGRQQVTTASIETLESGCDHLHAMLDAVGQRAPLPARPAIAELEAVETVAEETGQDEEAVESLKRDEARLGRGSTIRLASETVEELLNFAGEVSIFRSRIEQEIGSFRGNIGEIEQTVARLREQLRKLEQETEAQILARYEREHGVQDSTFDPLELDRYSTIQQLSRALAESVSDLNSLTELMDDAGRQAETLLMQQARVNTELQEGLMQARMVSFNTLAPRLRRVVRNAARDTGRQAELRLALEGEGELDRNVLDRVTAPIEHILRNAIAHGIETPADRRAAGKPESGTVTIAISREATELLIRITDDGAGLDYERIRERAVESGLLTPEQAEDREQLSQVIFQTGFSTAREISELAGRGVGMDVVASEIRQVGGRIAVDSQPGKGTEFTLRIPLSLAVMQAIFVNAGERMFAIPLQAVRGVARIRPAEWREALDSDGTYRYGGENYPLVELDPQLGLDPVEIGDENLSLLMISTGDQRAAVRVAGIEGHREIVLKPVGPQISSIPGILGGTIMGDGQVVVILDIAPLIERALSEQRLPGLVEAPEHARVEEEEVKRTPLVMVVDDSITMRRVTARILEHHGLEVVTARDGVEAVDQLYERVPDLMLLDIEMPRMDGFELAAYVRDDPRLSEVPIMMITSRSGDKHREHARELGVNRYLIKPYQETNMVRNVFEMLELPVPEDLE